MGLIVPLLRLLYVSLNVYDTFKTLKPPPPSSRNGGRPSVRAMSQRKRAMKGCLSIWIIWCCYAVYERSVDGIIGVFIPFYNEIKSLIILFFLITRSRGAEPIYLHVLRPLVKPYTGTLDAILEVVQHFGDLLLLLCAIPLHLVTSVYRRWILREKPTVAEKQPETPTDEQEPGPSEFGQTRARRNVLHNAHVRATATQSQPSTPPAQIWRPPPSAYTDSPPGRPVGLPTPPAEDQSLFFTPAQHTPAQHVDEWRQYENFPSAYPATPPSRTSGLPSIYPSLQSSLEGLPGNNSDQQGFYRSLQPSSESQNPDSDGDLSDDHHNHPGVHTDDEMSVDGYEEEEDDFNVTLRTPYPLSRIMNVSGITATSDDESQADDSTGLSTIDHGSPLQTRTNSEASSRDQSDASSTTGKKRPLPPSLRTITTTRPAVSARSSTQDTIRAKPTVVRPSIRAPLSSRAQSKEGESSAGDVPGNEDGEEVVKKRRVEVKANGRKPLVPLAKQGENKVPPRKVSTNGTSIRAPVRSATKLAPKTMASKPATRPLLAKESGATAAEAETA